MPKQKHLPAVIDAEEIIFKGVHLRTRELKMRGRGGQWTKWIKMEFKSPHDKKWYALITVQAMPKNENEK